ncbi:unnamed protein product [Arabidopsis thaliana]|uniref:Uncharacterized protein n=2 Tax=Arabidopsis thaliana TaxID=3702 RepID=A0A654FEZ3_ARATH|nr:uncharacterized protein AT3G45673 [Arabidopsis thaliana]AEE78058.1 hypothetical protein AT3G45673 [Arabidopsis thaliana]CAA0384598.1 unnamed protein product [Arabidopsis thaliana]VYS59455.1 unnamed protein product [Arabidopsis thaliana]|eukprot:NP_001118778.1 hypothetical protein AT3G45673 [Arabidopsis thaliana]
MLVRIMRKLKTSNDNKGQFTFKMMSEIPQLLVHDHHSSSLRFVKPRTDKEVAKVQDSSYD